MFVTCPCEHCGQNIEFATDDFQEESRTPDAILGQTVECPGCKNQTQLHIPVLIAKMPIKAKVKWSRKHTISVIIISAALLVVGLYKFAPDALDQLWGLAVLSLLAGFVALGIYAITKANAWLQLFCIGLFISGAVLILGGLIIFASTAAAKESTVFQEYEAIFLGIGGLVVIALSLILAALLEVNRSISIGRNTRTLQEPAAK